MRSDPEASGVRSDDACPHAEANINLALKASRKAAKKAKRKGFFIFTFAFLLFHFLSEAAFHLRLCEKA